MHMESPKFRFYKGSENDIKPVDREDLIAAIKNATKRCGVVVAFPPSDCFWRTVQINLRKNQ